MNMINHTLKCVFVHVPKCGGTSIIDAFDENWKQCRREIHFDEKYRDYFIFTVVRNPWDRFVSGWKYCGSTHQKTLTEVLRHLPTQDENDHDWRHLTVTQHEMLHKDGKLFVHHIMRFENLQEDFDRVCDIIGKSRVMLKHLNVTKHGHYHEYFTEQEQGICSMPITA